MVFLLFRKISSLFNFEGLNHIFASLENGPSDMAEIPYALLNFGLAFVCLANTVCIPVFVDHTRYGRTQHGEV